MQPTGEVTVDLSLMDNYEREIPAINRAVFAKWAVRYRSFTQRRWNRFARGGGDWAPLKYRKGSILRDTSTMFAAMAPTITPPAGSVNQFHPDGVVVGFGGGASHPGGPSILQIAIWHQTGAGNNPVREIIVLPDEQTLVGMRADMAKAHSGNPSA